MPRKAYQWAMLFLKNHSCVLSRTLLELELTDVVSLLALKGSRGYHSSHSLMEYGQCPIPSTSVPQDNLFQERSHFQSK